MDIKKEFWETIKKLRKQKWYSQEAFAAKCKIHRTHMGLIENGKTNITLDNIEKIAQALWVKPKELL